MEMFVMARSIDWMNVQIKTRRIWKKLVNEDSTMIIYSNDIKPKVVEVAYA
jgi:hypothetical protein